MYLMRVVRQVCTCAILGSRYHSPDTVIYSVKSGSKASRRTGAPPLYFRPMRDGGLDSPHLNGLIIPFPGYSSQHQSSSVPTVALHRTKKKQTTKWARQTARVTQVSRGCFGSQWRIRKFHDPTCKVILITMSSDYLNRIQPGSNPTLPFNWAVTYPQPDPPR